MPGGLYPKKLNYGTGFYLWHKPHDIIVDVGSGGAPYEYATILVDKFPTDDYQRGRKLVIPEGRNFIQADIESLLFKDKEVDFLFARHLFEHIENPAKACREIIRVAKRGYIETPTRMWERLFTRTPDKHRWIVEIEGEKLVFSPNEYGRVFGEFFDELFCYDNKFQVLFWNNYELFMNCYYWEDDFVWEIRK